MNDFNIAIKINPNLAEAYLSRGILLFLTNELNKALGDFNQALRINQDDPQAYLNRGLAYKKLNNKEAAIQDYNKAIRLDPTYLEAYQNRFFLYASIGKNEAALDDCNKMIELNPHDGYLFNLKANLFYRNFKDKSKACKDWSKAIELGYNKALIDYSNNCK